MNLKGMNRDVEKFIESILFCRFRDNGNEIGRPCGAVIQGEQGVWHEICQSSLCGWNIYGKENGGRGNSNVL